MIGSNIIELDVSFKYDSEFIHKCLDSIDNNSEVIIKGDNVLKYQELPGLLRDLNKKSIVKNLLIRYSDVSNDNEFFLLRSLIKNFLVDNVIIKCHSINDISNIEYLDKYSTRCNLIILVNESIDSENLLSLLKMDNSIVVLDSDTKYESLIYDIINSIHDKDLMKKLLYSDNVYNLLNESDIDKLYDYSIIKCIAI